MPNCHSTDVKGMRHASSKPYLVIGFPPRTPRMPAILNDKGAFMVGDFIAKQAETRVASAKEAIFQVIVDGEENE